MEHISSIIHKILKKSGNENVYYTGILKTNWGKFVGQLFERNSYPDRIYDKILFIGCTNPSLKQEFFFFKDKIVERVNNYFEKELISDIKVFIKPKN